MTTKITYTVVDDLDGTTARVGTYRFGLEGLEYEIDLSEDNLGVLRAALAPYVTAGRRLGKTTPPRRPARPAASRPATAEIRAWWAKRWQQLGLPEPTRGGPLPRQVGDAYDAAR
jgi:hypothetical protein